jgi:hypothetical protein
MKGRTESQKIVFQNQSHLVERYFNNCGICPTLKDIGLGTDLMVRFATEGYSKQLGEVMDRFDEYIQDKYKEK